MKTRISLILGGARSGKSRYAETQVAASGLQPVYLATGSAGDEEMRKRIDRHKEDRVASGLDWTTVEEPENLGKTLASLAKPGTVILVDCLTLWLTHCLCADIWPRERHEFIETLEKLIDETNRDRSPIESHQRLTPDCEIVIVSNETGLGVVPMGELSRQFVDESGFLHQQLAKIVHQVTLVVAGLPTDLKNT